MVVPHVDEGPASPRILQIGVVKVGPICNPIVVDCRGNVKVPDLLPVRVADEVTKAPIVHTLWPILGVPHDLVDEVAEVEHEVELLTGGSAFVLEDHSPVGG